MTATEIKASSAGIKSDTRPRVPDAVKSGSSDSKITPPPFRHAPPKPTEPVRRRNWGDTPAPLLGPTGRDSGMPLDESPPQDFTEQGDVSEHEEGEDEDPPDNGEEPEEPGDDDDEDDVWDYCDCCGCPWWDCIWCNYWVPIYGSYYGYDHDYWYNYWSSDWGASFAAFHENYDFSDHFPSIYTSAALYLNADSPAIPYLDEGTAFFRNGEYMEALHAFRLATLADIQFAVPKFAYAQALFAVGIYEYAAYEMERGMEMLPEWLDLGGDLTLMYGTPEDFEAQQAALLAHLKVWGEDEDGLFVLGYVSYFSGDLYTAEKAFEKLLSDPDPQTARTALLFLDVVEIIKEELRALEDPNQAPVEDDVTIEDILKADAKE